MNNSKRVDRIEIEYRSSVRGSSVDGRDVYLDSAALIFYHPDIDYLLCHLLSLIIRLLTRKDICEHEIFILR